MSKNSDLSTAFERFEKNGQNTVINLLEWLKESKVLEMVEKTEEEALNLFANVRDKENVTEEQFKNVVNRLIEEGNNKTVVAMVFDKFQSLMEAFKITNHEFAKTFCETIPLKQIGYKPNDEEDSSDEENN